MLFSTLFRRPRRPQPAARSIPRRSFVPRLDVLEDRTVPSFAGPEMISGVAGGSLIKVADFNNDTRPDLLTANGSSLNVSLRDSTGSYSASFATTLGAAITDVAVGRINGDAYPDIVVATGEKTISVFLGRGNGTFQSPIKVALPKGEFAMNLAIDDLTGDGKADLVVGAEGGTYRHNIPGTGISYDRRDSFANVLIGKGDGTFRAGGSTVVESHQVSNTGTPVPMAVPVALGDVNGDGKTDVVAAAYSTSYAFISGPSGDYHVRLLVGNGKGGLTVNNALWSAGWDRGGGAPTLAVNDLNGDGRADVVAAYPGSIWESSSLNVSLSNPITGKFTSSYFAVAGSPTAVAVADITGDGKLDIVVANGTTGGVELRQGNGDGSFGAAQSFAADRAFASMASIDLDGDGDLALVLVDGFAAFQMLNDGVW